MGTQKKRKNSLSSIRPDRTRRILVQLAVTAVLVGLIAAIGINVAIKKAERDDPGATPTVTAAPDTNPNGLAATLTDTGAIRIGKPSATRTVRLVADLQCPACRQFETTYGPLLTDAVNAGTIAAEYNIIAFLDRASSTEYSTRAANASYCAASADPLAYPDWLKTMFEHQPPEGGAGLPDSTLVDIAATIGYTDPAFAQCVTDQTYGKFVRARTLDILDSGIQSTPSVLLDGRPIDPAQLAEAIRS
ncbi:DsbA family protein [Nocardia flavorosea]|uniref:Thioredoxin domain-containing protein n=1 Tax=Nocardia flavorosea TaxID=53429 RepID=A0A846YEA6_9NOCA|nr:thioredoxin domain-containing protein [Nocardia flavorosea]NKY57015.1 thioredoxin domain-containing protein [Nocardia flavorosea]